MLEVAVLIWSRREPIERHRRQERSTASESSRRKRQSHARRPKRRRSSGKACKRPTRRRLRSIHGAAIEADTLAVADLWLEELTRLQPDVDAVRRVALWLASTSPIRGPVKIGWRCLARQGATKMSKSLFAALEQDQVDRALLTAAGDIVRTDRRACPGHRQLCRRRRRHRALPGPDARSRAESLPDYRPVAAIRDLCWCGRTLGGRPTRVERQPS